MKEIWRVKFNKHSYEIATESEGFHEKTIRYMVYTVGVTGEVDGEYLTPIKITLTKGRVRVDFLELGIRHVFGYTDDVELFYRDKLNTEKDEKN